MLNASNPTTALIVSVPTAEAVVGSWRLRYDPSAALGMPAHVTVLYPFVPLEHLGEAGIQELHALFGQIPAPELEFRGLGTFEEVLWLAPSDASSIVRLTEL